jgi:hypothetical protein
MPHGVTSRVSSEDLLFAGVAVQNVAPSSSKDKPFEISSQNSRRDTSFPVFKIGILGPEVIRKVSGFGAKDVRSGVKCCDSRQHSGKLGSLPLQE